MFQGLICYIKARIDVALKSAACGTIAAVAVTVALAFFCAAGFIALEARLGVIDACIVFGGAFLFVALTAATLLLVLRRRAARNRARLIHALDPQALAMGAEVVRLLGGRRAASIGLVGAFIVGVLLSRSLPKK